jgi:hypothetical protein
MSPLLFTCPATHQQAFTGIETDEVECPHCGGVHDVPVRETYVNNALQDSVARLGWANSLTASDIRGGA